MSLTGINYNDVLYNQYIVKYNYHYYITNSDQDLMELTIQKHKTHLKINIITNLTFLSIKTTWFSLCILLDDQLEK